MVRVYDGFYVWDGVYRMAFIRLQERVARQLALQNVNVTVFCRLWGDARARLSFIGSEQGWWRCVTAVVEPDRDRHLVVALHFRSLGPMGLGATWPEDEKENARVFQRQVARAIYQSLYGPIPLE